MSEIQRKALYSVASSLSALLVAFGVYSAADGDTLLGIVQAVVAAVPAIAGIIAHKHTPTAGVVSADDSSDTDGVVS